MATDLLTTCVLVPEPQGLLRTSTQMLERLGPVVRCSPDADAPHLDPVALWRQAVEAASTPWVLLLVDGEQVEADEVALRHALENPDAGTALRSPLVGTAPLVPDPIAAPGPRLLRRDQELVWALGFPVVRDTSPQLPPQPQLAREGNALLVHRRTTRIPLDGPAVEWLRAVAVRRSRERLGREDIAGTLLDAAVLTWIGEHDGAAVRSTTVVRSTAPAALRVLAARVLTGAGLAAGRLGMANEGAQAWLKLRDADPLKGEDPTYPSPAVMWAGLTATLAGDMEAAAAVIRDEEPPQTADPWLGVAAIRPMALALERQAADVEPLLSLLRNNPSTAPIVQLQRLAHQWHVLQRDPAELISRWPLEAQDRLQELVEECGIPTATWWLPLAAAWTDARGLQAPVAFRVLQIAAELEDVDAVQWTALMRAGGIDDRSPLLVKAAAPSLPARSRILAAALAYSTFSDAKAVPLLQAAAKVVPLADVRDLLLVVSEVAPSSLPLVVEHVAHEPGRMRHVADLLEEFGEQEAADELREMAESRGGR